MQRWTEESGIAVRQSPLGTWDPLEFSIMKSRARERKADVEQEGGLTALQVLVNKVRGKGYRTKVQAARSVAQWVKTLPVASAYDIGVDFSPVYPTSYPAPC